MMSCRLPNAKNIPSAKSEKHSNSSEETALSKPIPVSDAVNFLNSVQQPLLPSDSNKSKKSGKHEIFKYLLFSFADTYFFRFAIDN